MAEHAEVLLLAQRAIRGRAEGEVGLAVATCAQIADLFQSHAAREELGLFAELRGHGWAAAAVGELEEDHRRLVVGLATLAGGDLTNLNLVLSALVDHAEREDSDLFPAALQLLPDDAWDRIKRSEQPVSPGG